MAISSSRPLTLTELLRKAAEDFPDKLAFSFAGNFQISHSRVQEQIDHSASVLRSAGVSPGDVVALTFPANSIELVIMFLAVIQARAAAALLNPAYTQEVFEFYLSDSKLLLTDPNGNPSAEAAASKLGITQGTVSLPDPTGPVHISIPTLNGDSTHDLVHDFSNSPSDVALLLPTSGITGQHKVVPLTQHNLAASAQINRSVYRLTDSDSTVISSPLFHMHGLMAVLPQLSAGGSVTLPTLGQFSATTFWADIQATNATWYTAGPTVHQIIPDLFATKSEQCGLPKLRFICSYSASLAPAYLKGFESVFDAPVLEAYAKTEASYLICSNPLPQDGSRKPGSVGKPVGQELTILDDKGVPQPVGVAGEVCIRGPNVTKGYKNNTEANEAAFLFGWFHTGDLGYLDEDGYLYLLKDQINTAGSSQDHMTVDVEALISQGPGQNTSPILSFEIYQNTGSPGDASGPTQSYWIRWLAPLDALNFVSNAMADVFVNFPGDLTDVVHLITNRLNLNGIRQLVFLASCNLLSNAAVGGNYLPGELQEVHETYWRAQLIASVGAPIAVAGFTLLSSFRFSSDPEGWSNWIRELSRVNTAMIAGGPLAFYWMRNPATEN